MFMFNKKKYDCKTFRSFLSFTSADNTTGNNLRWPRKCSQTTEMVRIPYWASRIVGLRWRDVVNSLEWEHRSDVASKEEIDCVWLWFFCGSTTIFMNHTPQQHIQTRDAVRFIHLRGTVYPAVDYGCRGPWMYAAVDSVGFRRRTEQTELILAPVWTQISMLSWQNH